MDLAHRPLLQDVADDFAHVEHVGAGVGVQRAVGFRGDFGAQIAQVETQAASCSGAGPNTSGRRA